MGAVLYEMLTGLCAFPGKSQLSVASAILEKEPEPISTFQPMTPPALDHAVRRCLAKDPERRWQSAADLADELQWLAEAGSEAGEHGSGGTRLAFSATSSAQKRRIYLRSLDQLQASALSGTEDAQNPFFSPEGLWLGFFAGGKLKKISIQGGTAVTLCDAPNDRGGSWGEDGTIVFAPDTRVALSKVSSASGTAQPLTTLDKQAGEVTHRWPQFLPGGKTVMFTSSVNGQNYEDSDIVVYSTASGQRKTVQRGGFHARYVPTGHIVYIHEGTMFAVPFDLRRLEVTG